MIEIPCSTLHDVSVVRTEVIVLAEIMLHLNEMPFSRLVRGCATRRLFLKVEPVGIKGARHSLAPTVGCFFIAINPIRD
jgi:hypothetical protein